MNDCKSADQILDYQPDIPISYERRRYISQARLILRF